MRRVLNYLLAISFVLTIMVPITGIIVHKLASTLFLVLALIHVFLYRKRLDLKVRLFGIQLRKLRRIYKLGILCPIERSFMLYTISRDSCRY